MTKKAATIFPNQSLGSSDHVPEFVSNNPDPKTGVPKMDADGDVHDSLWHNMVTDRHVGGATHEGDMGRLSKL